MSKHCLGALLALLLCGISTLGQADPLPPQLSHIPLPPGLNFHNYSPEGLLKAFLGLSFRADGTISDDGFWATWQNPQKKLNSPGFNCSGFTLSAARFLLGTNFRTDDIKRDRANDSGPNSINGEDWDFGLDTILNLAQKRATRLLPWPTEAPLSHNAAGRPVGWGVSLHTPEFEEILKELRPEHLYFFVLSKPDKRFKGGLSYYHVGLIYPGSKGELWLYQSTLKAGVHRLDLNQKQNLASLRKHFPKPKNMGERRIFIVETKLNNWALEPSP